MNNNFKQALSQFRPVLLVRKSAQQILSSVSTDRFHSVVLHLSDSQQKCVNCVQAVISNPFANIWTTNSVFRHNPLYTI